MFGWFFLTSFDYLALSKRAVCSVTFLSNMIYWLEVGYFDAEADEKWLLHTWSLSVEWQFYILYPLTIVFLVRVFPLKIVKLTIVLATVVGFLFCVLVSLKRPDFAYYMLPARAWEMLAGGIAFLYPFKFSKLTKRVTEVVGLILIFVSYFWVTEHDMWPGYLGLLPVLGTILIIYGNNQYSLITGNIVFQN
ncbi:MAG: peptidoglycan/LPS O-acetylase OafA/YrhL [Paraglaciecola sp.]